MAISHSIEFFTQPASGGPTPGIGELLTMFTNGVGTIGIGETATFTSDISDVPLLRGPQVKQNDLAEDRLNRITSYTLSTTTAISLQSTGTTSLYTAPSDKSALILGVILQATAANTVTVPAQTSVGVNPSTDNVFATEILTGFDAVGDLYYMWNNTNKAVRIPAGGTLDLDVSVAATATSLEATARVVGILV